MAATSNRTDNDMGKATNPAKARQQAIEDANAAIAAHSADTSETAHG